MLDVTRNILNDARLSNNAIWGQSSIGKDNVTFRSNTQKTFSDMNLNNSKPVKSWIA